MNDYIPAMSPLRSAHVPDELEAALEAALDSGVFAIKEEVFPDDEPERAPGLLAILDRDQTYLGPEPFPNRPFQGRILRNLQK